MKIAAACIVAFALALGAAPAARACSPVRYDPQRIVFPRTDFAAVMFERAAFVEVAEAVSAKPIDANALVARALARHLGFEADPGRRKALRATFAKFPAELRRGGASSITFRSVERLKGVGAASFVLTGYWLPGRKSPPDVRMPGFPLPEEVYYSSFGEPEELTSDNFPAICTSYVSAAPGRRYLIFRGADGRLLGPSIPYRNRGVGETSLAQGFPYEPVTGKADPWLAQVRRAAKR